MPGELIPIIGIIFAFGIPGAIIITIAILKHRQKMELMRQGINPFTTVPSYPGKSSLLWGMVLVGIGIASVASSIYDPDHDLMRFGFLFLGAGIALIVYWVVSAPERKRAIQLYEQKILAEQESAPVSRSVRAANTVRSTDRDATPPQENEG